MIWFGRDRRFVNTLRCFGIWRVDSMMFCRFVYNRRFRVMVNSEWECVFFCLLMWVIIVILFVIAMT